ncbi:cytochrome P450 4d8-like [Cydia fagiglandana]|uniref:cytochrome P450 4d8-like n=1 Tax=Cydia fagiglandana TaxID=1458189 RepID=UPI002FEE5C29
MQALQNLGRTSNEHDGLTSFWVANRLLVSMTDPKAIEVVSKACLDKDEFLIKYMRTAIGNGSIFAPVNIWHLRRKINAPFFSRKNLDQLMPVFDAKSSIMADLLRTEAGGGDFPIWRYVTTFTFDTVCENSNNELSHFIDVVIQSSGGLEKGYSNMELREELLVFMVAGSDTSATAVSYTAVLLSRYPAVQDKVYQDDTSATAVSYTAVLLFRYPDVQDKLLVFMVAGSDTSATAVSYTAVLLFRYPDVQDKVYQEIQEVFGESDRAVTAEDLLKLTYLEAVIKESLRLYPPVPIVVREVHEDILLPSGTTLVDETTVMFNIWGTHRNPAYWGPDAEEFRPERFLQGPLPHPAMFVPFSYSVRNCLG